MERLARALDSGEAVRYETAWCGTDFLVTVCRIGPNRVVSSGVDITDRKSTESASRASERRYQALIEQCRN